MGTMKSVAVEFTRPADTTAYTIGDVIGPASPAVMTFAGIGAGGSRFVHVKGCRVTTNSTNVTTSGMALHLFNSSITPIADNAPFTFLWANRTSYQGTTFVGDLQTYSGMGYGAGSDAAYGWASADYEGAYGQNPVLAKSASNGAIYGVLAAIAAYTPASGQIFRVELIVEQYQ